MITITNERKLCTFLYEDDNLKLSGQATLSLEGKIEQLNNGTATNEAGAVIAFFNAYKEPSETEPKININNASSEYIGLVSVAIAACMDEVEEYYAE